MRTSATATVTLHGVNEWQLTHYPEKRWYQALKRSNQRPKHGFDSWKKCQQISWHATLNHNELKKQTFVQKQPTVEFHWLFIGTRISKSMYNGIVLVYTSACVRVYTYIMFFCLKVRQWGSPREIRWVFSLMLPESSQGFSRPHTLFALRSVKIIVQYTVIRFCFKAAANLTKGMEEC